ncbi:MAG: hypothetical protein U0R71_09740 [Solirubrobacterales bacterium]
MAPTWFDRAATRRTRREALRAAGGGIAAAAAASVPFVRGAAEAKAAKNPNECRKGCIWTVNQKYHAEKFECQWSYEAESAVAATFHFFYVSPFLVPISNAVYAGRERRCINRAYQKWKPAFEQICLQPFCPGFNPKGEGGPCDSCPPEYSCNPCEALETGYICCVYPQGDCHGDCCTAGSGCP